MKLKFFHFNFQPLHTVLVVIDVKLCGSGGWIAGGGDGGGAQLCEAVCLAGHCCLHVRAGLILLGLLFAGLEEVSGFLF